MDVPAILICTCVLLPSLVEATSSCTANFQPYKYLHNPDSFNATNEAVNHPEYYTGSLVFSISSTASSIAAPWRLSANALGYVSVLEVHSCYLALGIKCQAGISCESGNTGSQLSVGACKHGYAGRIGGARPASRASKWDYGLLGQQHVGQSVATERLNKWQKLHHCGRQRSAARYYDSASNGKCIH